MSSSMSTSSSTSILVTCPTTEMPCSTRTPGANAQGCAALAAAALFCLAGEAASPLRTELRRDVGSGGAWAQPYLQERRQHELEQEHRH